MYESFMVGLWVVNYYLCSRGMGKHRFQPRLSRTVKSLSFHLETMVIEQVRVKDTSA